MWFILANCLHKISAPPPSHWGGGRGVGGGVGRGWGLISSVRPHPGYIHHYVMSACTIIVSRGLHSDNGSMYYERMHYAVILWYKNFKSFPPCYSQSPLLNDFTPPTPPPPGKSGLKLVCNINSVDGYLKSKNSQDYAQKSQQNCTFMNSTSGKQFPKTVNMGVDELSRAVVVSLKRHCAINSAWPRVDLSFFPWLLLFK
jgi:hypothetical protein